MENRQRKENYLTEKSKSAAMKHLTIHSCGWEMCKKRHSAGPFAHNSCYRIHYVVSGRGLFLQNGREYRLEAGWGFLAIPGKATVCRADSSGPWEYYWMTFDGEAVMEILEKVGVSGENPVFVRSLSDGIKYLKSAVSDFGKNGSRQMAVVGNLLLFLSGVGEQALSAKERQSADDYVELAVSYIDINYCNDLSVQAIANYIGINRSYLFRIFSKKTGMSLHAYILKRRLLAACEMLKNTNNNITQISFACGFNNLNHFSKFFKVKMGVSPTGFRKKHTVVNNSEVIRVF